MGFRQYALPKLILWDLDGTLCPHNKQFHQDAPLAVATAAIDLGARISNPARIFSI